MSCMLILNAAEGRLQLLLAEETTLLCAQEWTTPAQGTEMLAPLLADALQRLHLTPADLGRIACVTGPGSFTGLRLALATAAGLRRAVGARLAGINYLRALAAGVGGIPGTRARILTHARRNLVHCQDFLLTETLPEPLSRPASVTLEQAAQPSSDFPELVLGSGLDRNRPFFESAFAHTPFRPRLLPPLWSSASPASLLSLALAADWQDQDLEPLYLRPCDAVDNLDAIATRRGQSGAEARAELERLLNTPPAAVPQ